MFNHRAFKESDAEIIARFPQSAEELFYMFPKAEYPLQPEILIEAANNRFYPTVVIWENEPAGYGNFIHVEEGNFCTIGNVIVNPAMRRRGVAVYLVETLSKIAFNKLNAEYVKASCFNDNTAGLLLYGKLDFVPVDMEVRLSPNKQKVVLVHLHKYATPVHP